MTADLAQYLMTFFYVFVAFWGITVIFYFGFVRQIMLSTTGKDSFIRVIFPPLMLINCVLLLKALRKEDEIVSLPLIISIVSGVATNLAYLYPVIFIVASMI